MPAALKRTRQNFCLSRQRIGHDRPDHRIASLDDGAYAA